MKKKLLFIDYQFHKKTKSTMFLLEILEEYFDISYCYCSLQGKCLETDAYCKDAFDCAVFFQIFPNNYLIDKLQVKTLVFFPMYDSSITVSNAEWLSLKNVLIINFSRSLFEKLINLGLNAKYIQYFPKPQKFDAWGSDENVFFWQRTKDIHINYLIRLLDCEKVKKIHIHKSLDPGHYFIPPKIMEGYKYEYSTWLDSKYELNSIIMQSAYYISPRLTEGIGMSFLDAMALGRCVIAPNYPTMNEYIISGETGILYEYNNPNKIICDDVRKIQKNALDYIAEGYHHWQSVRHEIIEWIVQEIESVHINNDFFENEKIVDLSNERLSAELRKFKDYYFIFNKWQIIHNRGMSVSDYLINNNIFSVAIYGYADLGRRLEEELNKSKVKISYIIDKKYVVSDSGENIYSRVDDSFDVDAIIVTAVFSFDEIKNELQQQTNSQIISLDKLLDYLLRLI